MGPSRNDGLPTVAAGTTPAAFLGAVVADILPMAAEIVLAGMQTRANIRLAVRAIETSHDLRMEAVRVLEEMLDRHGEEMSREVRDAYFVRLLELLDPHHYRLPLGRLLPRG